jgi:two-component sensor histidine kinase
VEVELQALDRPREVDGTAKTLCLVVRDDGVGLPLHIDLQELPSLGLRLVSILTAQIRGTLEIERGGGTRFTITFPSRLP